MAEVLRSIDEPISDDLGTYHVRVVGRCCDDDGMWEGWLEFESLDGKTALSGNGAINYENGDIALGINSPSASFSGLSQIMRPIFSKLS